MKKCEQFRDLILTDFIDGRLDKESSGKVENHLLDCAQCRAFFKELKNNVLSPLQQAPCQPVPAALWDAVKQNIENTNEANPLSDFWDQLKVLLAFPKMVPVFASLMLMLLVGSVTLNTVQLEQAKDKDQGEYLVSLLTPISTTSQADSNDLGTPIEHYFL